VPLLPKSLPLLAAAPMCHSHLSLLQCNCLMPCATAST